MDKNTVPQIGILVGTRNEWGRKIVKGILSYASDAGHWHVWIRPLPPHSFEELPRDRHFHGIIAHVNSTGLAEKLQNIGLPTINVADTPIDGFSAPCVRTDDHVTTRMGAEFFIKRGFKNIALAGPFHKQNPAWYAKAFKKVLSEYGLGCSVFLGFNEQPDYADKLTAWLKQLPKPVGILTWGHQTGRNIIDFCSIANIPVPGDVAVLAGGYDELLSYVCHPPLSGILTPTEQIGHKAAELLHRMMQGKKVPHTETFLPPVGIMEHLSTDTLAVEDKALLPLVRFLKQHALENITMQDMQNIAHMSRSSLERRYRKVFGHSPFEEVRSIRINHARKLLTETNKPLQIIAEECGYTTYNYLAHVFKQATGISPSNYRKTMRPH